MCYRLKYTGKQVDDRLGQTGTGPYDYENLTNLPKINGETLKGDVSTSTLNLVSSGAFDSAIARIDEENAKQDSAIAILEEQAITGTEKDEEQDAAIAQLKSRVTNTEQKNTVQDGSIKTLEESVKTLNDNIVDIETKDQDQDTLIESLQADIARIDEENAKQDSAIATKANLSGGNVFTGVQQFKDGASFGDVISEGVISLKGSEGITGQVLTSQGAGQTPEWKDLPTHLAQTSQRIYLTLSAGSWQDSGSVWSGPLTLDTSSTSQQISQGYGFVKTIPWYTAKKILVTTDYDPIELSEISFTGSNKSQKIWSYAGTQQLWAGVRFYASSGRDAYTGQETYTIGFTRPLSSGITVLKKIDYTEADTVFQSREINGVAENTEVRFVLSDDNGILASQYGLRPWIQKTDNKLTFIAEAQPSANIAGTLEIGETSAAASALVAGIAQQALPIGGASGQILAKLSGTTGDVGWINNNGVPAGGEAGYVLTKNTNEDGDVVWAAPSSGASMEYQDLKHRPRINGLVLDSYTLETGDITKTTLEELDIAQNTEVKAQNYYYSAAVREAYLGAKPDTGILKAPVEVPTLFAIKSSGGKQTPIGYVNNNYPLNLVSGETYVVKATISEFLSGTETKEYEGEAYTSPLDVVSVGFSPKNNTSLGIGDHTMIVDFMAYSATANPAGANTFARGCAFTAEGFDPSTKIIFESLKWKGATATNLLKQPLVPPEDASYFMELRYKLGLKDGQIYKITIKKGTDSRDYLVLARNLDIGVGGAAIPCMICYAVPNPQQTEATALEDGGMIVFYDGVNQYFVSEPNDVYMFAPIDGEEGDKVAEDYQIRAIEAATNVDSFALPLQFEFDNYNNIMKNSSGDYYFGEILKISSPLNTIAVGKTVSLTGTLNSSSGTTAINGSATAVAKHDGWEIVFSDIGLYITNVFDDTNVTSDEYAAIGVVFGTQGTGCTITNITVSEGE